MSDTRPEDLEKPPIPRGWAWAELHETAAASRFAMTDGPFGSKLKSAHYVNEGVRVIRLGNIGAGRFKDSDKSYVTQDHYQGLKKHEAFPGDLLIAALAEPVGRCCEVPPDIGTAIVKADCIRFAPHEQIDSQILMHWLNSPLGRHNSEQLSHGIGRLRMNLKSMRALPTPVPPLNEQRRIVAKIEALQARSDAAKQALDAIPPLLEKFRQSVLAAAFRGDLTRDWRAQNPDMEPASVLLERIRKERKSRFIEDAAEKARAKAEAKAVTAGKGWTDADNTKVLEGERVKAEKKYKAPEPADTTDLPELPEGWCWTTLDALTALITSGSRAWTRFYGGGSGVFILAGNVRPGRLELSEVQKVDPPPGDPDASRSQVEQGDLLVTIVGANTGDVCSVETPLPEHYVCQSVALIRPVSRELTDWLLPHFMAGDGRLQFEEVMYGQGRPHLSFDDLRACRVPIPPPPEMQEIIRITGDVEPTLTHLARMHRDATNSVNALTQSILSKAFRGELVLQDPDDEPASVLLERIRAERDQLESAKMSKPSRAKKRAKS